MKKSIEKILCSLLIVVMCLISAPVSGLVGLDFGAAKASASSELAPSGQCGDNVTYTFDSSTGLLTISGTGEIENFELGMGDNNLLFGRNDDIKNVVIENGVTSIGNYSFYGCSNLISITIPESVTSIGDYVFAWCPKLENVTIPVKVKTIGKYAFYHCYSLKSITIPAAVTAIGELAFAECCNLARIDVDPDNEYFSNDEYGVLFDKDFKTLIRFPCGSKLQEYTMPSTVTNVAQYAFFVNGNLKTLNCSDSIKTISKYTFYGCCFESVILPNKLERIEENAFLQCLELDNLVIPETTKYIGDEAFYINVSLKNITILSKDVVIDGKWLGYKVTDDVSDEALKLWIQCFNRYATGEIDENTYLTQCYEIGAISFGTSDSPNPNFTIKIHDDGIKYTAEDYAVENGINYVRCHFFEGTNSQWSYDWEKCVRTRKCLYCDYVESEDLQKKTQDGVEVILPTVSEINVIAEKVEVDNANYIIVEKALEAYLPNDYKIVKAYNINTVDKNGALVQPNGTVKVKIAGDWSENGKYNIYRVNDDGTLTDMHAYCQDNYLVFDTDHFSLYVVTDQSKTTDTGSDTPSDGEETSFFSKLLAFIRRIIETIKNWFK